MRLTARLAFVATALALAIWIPTGHAEDGESWALEDRVPASTLAFVSLEDVGSWEQRFEKTAIYKLTTDPEMKAFLDPLVEDIEAMLTSEDSSGPLAEVPPVVMELLMQLQGLQGQLGIALLDMDLENEMPRAVASLDFGDRVDDFITFLTRMKAELGEDGEAIQTFERDGRTWWQVDTGGPVISATTIDTAFVVATDPEALQSVLGGAIAGNLAQNEHFTHCRTESGGDNLGAFVYANVPHIVELLSGEMDEKTTRIANALGLDTVKGASYGLSFAGDGFMETFVVHTPDADHGLPTLELTSPMRPKALSMVPSSAFYYSESTIRMDDLLPRVRTLVSAIDADALEEMEGGLEHMNQSLGVDIEKELLPGMANRIAMYAAMPETGGLYPEIAIMLSVKDPAAYEAVFGRFAEGLSGMITQKGEIIASTRTIDYRGKALHLFEMQKAEGDDMIPFTPTWTMNDDWLVLTLVPYTLKEMLLRTEQQGQSGAGAGLAGEEDFASLIAHMPADAGAIEYLDLQAIVNLLYDTAVPALQTAVKPNMLPIPLRLDWAQLPPARAVRQHFRSLAAFSTWNRDGIKVSVHEPFPLMGIAIAAAAGFAAFGFAAADAPGDIEWDDTMPGVIEVEPMDMDAELAEVQAQELLRYVRLFQLENERAPKSLQELVDAKIMRQVQKDPWGNAFKLRVLEQEKRMYVVSAGPDGKFETGDDIVAGGD